jgi:hypothetical protein
MIKQNFLKEFKFNIESAPVTLKHCAKYYLTKALRAFFNNRHVYNLAENQVFAIILKVKFSDGSIKSISTMRKANKTSLKKLSTLFKELLNRRSEDYSELKVDQLIFSYHIYTEDYVDLHKDLFMNENILSESPSELRYKEEGNIKFMAPSNLFKLPLSYADSIKFLINFKKLNPDVTDLDSHNYKYKIMFDTITMNETIIKIVLQSTPDVVIYQFKDRLITVPKLDLNELIVERTLMSKEYITYLLDQLTFEILLIKKLDIF